MNKKLVFITVGLISALLFIQKATSFSEGVVNSSVNINVTNQENALISAFQNESLIVHPGIVNEFYVNIYNRVGYQIELEGGRLENDGLTFTYDTASIGKGEVYLHKIYVELDEEYTNQYQLLTYQIPLQFKWDFGEATIPLEVALNIEEEVVIDDDETKEKEETDL